MGGFPGRWWLNWRLSKSYTGGRRIKGILRRAWCVQGGLGNLVWNEFKKSLKRRGQRSRQRPLVKDLSLVLLWGWRWTIKEAKLWNAQVTITSVINHTGIRRKRSSQESRWECLVIQARNADSLSWERGGRDSGGTAGWLCLCSKETQCEAASQMEWSVCYHQCSLCCTIWGC